MPSFYFYGDSFLTIFWIVVGVLAIFGIGLGWFMIRMCNADRERKRSYALQAAAMPAVQPPYIQHLPQTPYNYTTQPAPLYYLYPLVDVPISNTSAPHATLSNPTPSVSYGLAPTSLPSASVSPSVPTSAPLPYPSTFVPHSDPAPQTGSH
ncbi:MAG: hypothetical protein J3R72DRAFT_431600 [Linnemannia gamsii]|nr:MAG: hypothetical protein J3R72DRAFT_431600 [Linnemannia gamsii]